MTLVKITDHADQALALLLSQFDESDRLRELLQILCDEIQRLENVAHDVLTKSLIDNAVGKILDEYGPLVLTPRGALTDDQYRALIRTTGAAHQSDAIPDPIIEQALIWWDRALYRTLSPGIDLIVGDHQLSGDVLIQAKKIFEIMRTVGLEIRIVQHGNIDDVFRYDSGPGYDLGKYAERIV
jgi:hypothetical protein